MEHISVIYITEKIIKVSKSHVKRVVFDGTNYYIFIFDAICSPKPCQRFLKGRFVCILQPKPRNSTFVVESDGVLL